MIFYEAPHKLKNTLADLYKYFGDRKISLCRELTKINEEVCRTTISEAIKIYEEKDPRGEYVLVVGGADKKKVQEEYPADPVEHVKALMDSGMKKMEAVKTAAKLRGEDKNDIYKLVLDL